MSWQNWHFHFRIDPKAGVVVTNVSYTDGGKQRSILYEGSLAEIFVPYQDPAEGWYHTTFLDMGEGNLWGSVASTLEPGADCPDNACLLRFRDRDLARHTAAMAAHGVPVRARGRRFRVAAQRRRVRRRTAAGGATWCCG